MIRAIGDETSAGFVHAERWDHARGASGGLPFRVTCPKCNASPKWECQSRIVVSSKIRSLRYSDGACRFKDWDQCNRVRFLDGLGRGSDRELGTMATMYGTPEALYRTPARTEIARRVALES